MKSLPVTAFLLSFVLFKVVTSVSDVDRIANGFRAKITDMPWLAFIKIKKVDEKIRCGGSIISKNHVLTAGHCLDRATKINITIGTAKPASGRGMTYISTLFKIHPLYDRNSQNNDVGFIIINEGMKLDGKKTNIVSLANEGDNVDGDSYIEISGWGSTSYSTNKGSKSLWYTVAHVKSDADCKTYIDQLPSNAFCAVSIGEKTGPCKGDDGGPAIAYNTKTQVGIISAVGGCGDPNFPGIYMRIADSGVRGFIKNGTGV